MAWDGERHSVIAKSSIEGNVYTPKTSRYFHIIQHIFKVKCTAHLTRITHQVPMESWTHSHLLSGQGRWRQSSSHCEAVAGTPALGVPLLREHTAQSHPQGPGRGLLGTSKMGFLIPKRETQDQSSFLCRWILCVGMTRA